MLELKTNEYPKDGASQNAKAVTLTRDLVSRVLGREEPFTLTVRKITQFRYSRDNLILVPQKPKMLEFVCIIVLTHIIVGD